MDDSFSWLSHGIVCLDRTGVGVGGTQVTCRVCSSITTSYQLFSVLSSLDSLYISSL